MDESEISPLSPPEPGALFTPAHGYGALRYGSLPGNKGGLGARPSRVRAACLKIVSDEGPQLLREIIRDPTERTAERLKALEIAAKYGLADVEVVAPGSMVMAIREAVARCVDDGTIQFESVLPFLEALTESLEAHGHREDDVSRGTNYPGGVLEPEFRRDIPLCDQV